MQRTSFAREVKKPILPCGHRVLIMPFEVSDRIENEETKSVIIKPEVTTEREQQLENQGILIAAGDMAFKAFGGRIWAKPGDLVLYLKHEGEPYAYGGRLFRVMNDEGIVGVTPHDESIPLPEIFSEIQAMQQRHWNDLDSMKEKEEEAA